MTRTCGYTLVDKDGEEYPCDRPGTSWRWYQDCAHEDVLTEACTIHENEGGLRMHALEAERDELRAKVAELRAALAGDGYCVCDDGTTYAKDCGIRVHREKARTRREGAE